MDFQVWIGLVGVIPERGNLFLGEGIGGAYVNALCYASSPEDFQARVSFELGKMGLHVLEFEDVELFSRRENEFKVDEALITLAKEVELTKEVRFGTYHTFPPNGAN